MPPIVSFFILSAFRKILHEQMPDTHPLLGLRAGSAASLPCFPRPALNAPFVAPELFGVRVLSSRDNLPVESVPLPV
jgi:hypothetical protein